MANSLPVIYKNGNSNGSGIVLTVLLLVNITCFAQTKMVSGNSLQPIGRYVKQPDGKLEMITSGAYTSFSFSGKTCTVNAAVAANEMAYLQYELDGQYKKRLRIDANHASFVIDAPEKGRHKVTLYKTTEATTGPLYITSITGKNIKALPAANKPIIEFIGNSITCGAAADDSEMPCSAGTYHDHHNAYYAYGPRVARALDVHFVLSSVSGIGIYRNWNDMGPSMPEKYGYTSFQEGSSNWNVSSFTPKIVSIALGTNDFSMGDGVKPRPAFDSAQFVDRYIDFVKTIKGKYPQARIALLSSGMVQGNNRLLFQNCLDAVKTVINKTFPEAKPIEVFFFAPMQARGCSGHPNVEDHKILADQLIPFFKALLNG